MYSTCLFCHRDLGRNESIEAFPVGRRLAFDPVKGRLWVVCLRCGRWNLTPLEERWEPVEECERTFRATKLCVATENIGLARAAEGTDLVRIGRAHRPELAAWRYGAQLGRRYRRHVVSTAVGAAVFVPLLVTGSFTALVSSVPGGMIAYAALTNAQVYRERRAIVTRTKLGSGGEVVVRRKHVPSARLLERCEHADAWSLQVTYDQGVVCMHGADALHATSRLLAHINQSGGSAELVQRAVCRLESERDGDALFRSVARNSPRDPLRLSTLLHGRGSRDDAPGTLRSLAVADRLALEMATHEETERRALEGELRALEIAWREAEEIAAIADSLALPPRIEGLLERYRRNRSTAPPRW